MTEHTETTPSTQSFLRFTSHGREFGIEASYSEPNSAIIVGMYVNGRLIFSEAKPAMENSIESGSNAILREAAEELKAQVCEMYAFLDEIDESPETGACIRLAALFFSRALYGEATRLYSTAQEMSPAENKAFYGAGLAHLELGEYAEACEHFSRAVSLKPLYADYRNSYGLALVWAGRISEGFKQLDQALELNTYFADAYYNYGLAYLFDGIKGPNSGMSEDYVNQSRAMLEKAALIDSMINGKEFQTGLRLLGDGNARDAFGAFKRNRDWVSRERAPSYDERRADFLVHQRSSDQQVVNETIVALQEQLERNPGFVDVTYKLALAHLRRAVCDWRSGLEFYQQTLERNPDFAKAVKAYDIAYLSLGDIERAITNIEGLDDSPRRKPSV